MIIRVFRAVVHDGKQDDFKRFFLEEAVPLLRRQAGMTGLTVGLPTLGASTEFVMITTWESVEAIQAFAGPDWRSAVIHPNERHLLKDTWVHHYEECTPAP